MTLNAAPDAMPDESNTVAEIKAYAQANGIKLSSGLKKAEMLEVIHGRSNAD